MGWELNVDPEDAVAFGADAGLTVRHKSPYFAEITSFRLEKAEPIFRSNESSTSKVAGTEGYNPVAYIPYIVAAEIGRLLKLDFPAMLLLMRFFGRAPVSRGALLYAPFA